MTELPVAVADLARFCHRSGDIDHRFTPSPTGVQGIAGHQRLYSRRPASYKSEYALEYRHKDEDVSLLLRGRADGYDPERGIVEEIKTCRVAPDSIPAAVAQLHLAQGRLYAAIIAEQESRSQLEVRVTWFNIDTDEEHSESTHYSGEELSEFLRETLSEFATWLRALGALREARDSSISTLTFPHGEFRDGQRDIAELAYKCVDQGGELLLEAPTGIGKTAAVLFPALKALARDKHDKLIFTTAKTVGRRAAEDTLAHFRAAGFRGSALSLTAKETICLSPGRACHGDDCPYARNYYDKLPAALAAAVERPSMGRDDMEALAREFEVCPYELSLDLLPWVDIVIADVHYVYSLTGTLSARMASDSNRWSVLVDEAHNLPGRARNMYSAELTKAQLMNAKSAAKGGIGKALSRINRLLLALQKKDWMEPEFDSSDTLPQDLTPALQALSAAVSEQLAKQPAYLHQHPAVMDFYFQALQFMRVAEQWLHDYRFEMHRDIRKDKGKGTGKQSLRLVLNCLDPARLLRERQQRAHAVTVFSATLTPLPWSRASLGLQEDAVCYRASSPFKKNQLNVSLATHVDTRYRQRDASLPALVDMLSQWLRDTPGNCIVYFPSYAYLDNVLSQLDVNLPTAGSRTLWRQKREGGDAQQRDLLARLAIERNIAAFCILGGVFGEGIDLPGDQLSSVVIIGVGMPQINRDTKQLQAWYEEHYGQGFDYAFTYPGMQKVDQALGRVVRTMEDHGSALLIDPRYREPRYRELLPAWWNYEFGR